MEPGLDDDKREEKKKDIGIRDVTLNVEEVK
jgi:hypothetical protein